MFQGKDLQMASNIGTCFMLKMEQKIWAPVKIVETWFGRTSERGKQISERMKSKTLKRTSCIVMCRACLRKLVLSRLFHSTLPQHSLMSSSRDWKPVVVDFSAISSLQSEFCNKISCQLILSFIRFPFQHLIKPENSFGILIILENFVRLNRFRPLKCRIKLMFYVFFNFDVGRTSGC